VAIDTPDNSVSNYVELFCRDVEWKEWCCEIMHDDKQISARGRQGSISLFSDVERSNVIQWNLIIQHIIMFMDDCECTISHDNSLPGCFAVNEVVSLHTSFPNEHSDIQVINAGDF
jgi:hypothetical protein